MIDGAGWSVIRSVPTDNGSFICQTRHFDDINLAGDLYQDYIDELNGDKPARMCAARSRRMRCCAKNCPARFGGAAYWEIFRASCLHRTK